jgi:hypothetical protein
MYLQVRPRTPFCCYSTLALIGRRPNTNTRHLAVQSPSARSSGLPVLSTIRPPSSFSSSRVSSPVKDCHKSVGLKVVRQTPDKIGVDVQTAERRTLMDRSPNPLESRMNRRDEVDATDRRAGADEPIRFVVVLSLCPPRYVSRTLPL